MRKAAIAISGAVVVGVLLLFALKARSSASGEPSGSTSPAGTAVGATASNDAGPSRPQWSTEEDPHWKTGIPLRPMDRDIIAALQSGMVERTAMLDVFPDKPYKVRFAGNPATQSFAYVLVDLNRDDQIDEKWDLTKPGQIERTVNHDPGADGQPVMFTLVRGRWQAH